MTRLMWARRVAAGAGGSLALLGATWAHAQQCGEGWLPGGSIPGLSFEANASCLWDPDGPGPEQPRLVVAGLVNVAGDVSVRGAAVWDLQQERWTALPGTLDSPSTSYVFHVYAVSAMSDGSLVLGGVFSSVSLGGLPIAGIARWTGATWDNLGGGVTGPVYATAAMPNGDIVAAGSFTAAGGVAVSNIARWDGTAWHPLGVGTNNTVFALTVMPNGDLIAGGEFTTAGGLLARRVARWNGTSWAPLGTGVSGSETAVRALTVAPNGTLVAGGSFSAIGSVGANNVALWDGTSWAPLGLGTNNEVRAVAVLPDQRVLVGGYFTQAGGSPAGTLAVWDGTSWASFENFYTGFQGPLVNSITLLPNSEVFVCGRFSRAGSSGQHGSGIPALNAAKWSGSAWSALSTSGSEPVDADVQCLAALPSGQIVAGGTFTLIGGVSARGLATWDGACWSAMPGEASNASALHVLGDGRLLGAVEFDGLQYVAIWNGDAWEALSPGTVFGGPVRSLLETPDGRIVVGGYFNNLWYESDPDWQYVPGFNSVAVWNGQDWEPLSDGLIELEVRALAWLPGSGLIAGAGGSFGSCDLGVQGLHRWDGERWESFAGGISGCVSALLALPDGRLVVGGWFNNVGDGVPARRIAMWDGSAWSPMGSTVAGVFVVGQVEALALDPGGNIVATGSFGHWSWAPANYGQGIARWDGSNWQRYGDGISYAGHALAIHQSGELIVGGSISSAGGRPSASLARWTDTGAPWVARPPQSTVVRRGQTVVLSSTPATRALGVHAQWRRDGDPVTDGQGGASAGGGVVTGASGPLESPTAGLSALLSIADVQFSDAGTFTAVFANDCGEAESAAAVVTVVCAADFDLNGVVETSDIFLFLSQWFAGEPGAYNFGGTPGVPAIFAYLIEWFTPCL